MKWAAVAVLLGGAVAVASIALVAREPKREQEHLPDVVLERGTFRGVPWVFGTSRFTSGESCIELVFEPGDAGCGLYRPDIRALKFYTSTGGDPSGIRSAQGFVSEEVASVLTLSGGRPVGDARVIDLPDPVAGKTRAVIAFVDDSELVHHHWIALALDSESRVIDRDVIFD